MLIDHYSEDGIFIEREEIEDWNVKPPKSSFKKIFFPILNNFKDSYFLHESLTRKVSTSG